MNQSHVTPTAVSEAGGRPAVPRRPQAAPRASRWTGGRVAALVIGGLLVLLSLVLLGAGVTGVWADRSQRDGGYVTTGVHEFSTSGSALSTVSTELGSAGVGWLYSPSLLGKVRIRVTPVSGGAPLFVGIGRSSDIDRYLAGVSHTVISEFFEDRVEPIGGGPARSAPGTRDFWVASTAGPGARTLEWDPTDGSWTVVVMNADGRPGINVGADLGARMPAVPWIATGLLMGGAVLLAGGGLLIAGAIRARRAGRASTDVTAASDSTAGAPAASSGPRLAAHHPEDEGRSHAER